jgi:acetylornithine deacetylase/succinyl-diaminopimelate desuccinylase-like protein
MRHPDTILAAVLAELTASRAADLDELAQFVAIESVSSDPTRTGEMRRAAEYLAALGTRIGLAATTHETDGAPIVTLRRPGATGPRAIVYAHYDVQPADPLEPWASAPFAVARRDGRLYGRGVSDDKGQLLMHLTVARAFIAATGSLPIDLCFVLEGDEERASPHLEGFVATAGDDLRAEVAIVTDGSMLRDGEPSVGYGVRGIAYIDVAVRALAQDAHSGIFGGAAPNAAAVLAQALASLHRPDGTVAVDGFEDDVRRVDDVERARLATVPYDTDGIRASLGARAWVGDARYSVPERLWIRPTLEINGIDAGYTGDGMKTIVPAAARARLSARLVPDQRPEIVAEAIESHLRRVIPAWADLEARLVAGAPGAVVDVGHPLVEAASAALEEAFGVPAVLQRHGGSIPAIAIFSQTLGIPTIQLGFGAPDANAHAPNEWLSLHNFDCGRAALARLWLRLGASSTH